MYSLIIRSFLTLIVNNRSSPSISKVELSKWGSNRLRILPTSSPALLISIRRLRAASASAAFVASSFRARARPRKGIVVRHSPSPIIFPEDCARCALSINAFAGRKGIPRDREPAAHKALPTIEGEIAARCQLSPFSNLRRLEAGLGCSASSTLRVPTSPQKYFAIHRAIRQMNQWSALPAG